MAEILHKTALGVQKPSWESFLYRRERLHKRTKVCKFSF